MAFGTSNATRREFASIMAAVALWHRHGRMRGGKGNREESSPRGIDAECQRRAMSPYVGLVTWSSTRSGPSELPHFLMIFYFYVEVVAPKMLQFGRTAHCRGEDGPSDWEGRD